MRPVAAHEIMDSGRSIASGSSGVIPLGQDRTNVMGGGWHWGGGCGWFGFLRDFLSVLYPLPMRVGQRTTLGVIPQALYTLFFF